MRNQGPDPATAANGSAISNVIGSVSGLIGILSAVVVLATPLLKLAGVLACTAIVLVLWQAVRDRSHGQLSDALMWRLVVAGLCVLVLVVMLGAQAAPKPPSPQQPGAAGGRPTTGPPGGNDPTAPPAALTVSPGPVPAPTEAGSAPSQPGSVWLSDQRPVDHGEGWEPGSAVVNARPFAHSVIVGTCFDSQDRASYQLARQYQRFTAAVGLSDDAPTDARIRVTVLADATPVVTRSVGVGTISPLDVPVAGAFRLTIQIEPGGLACDNRNLVLGDARLLR